MTLQELIDAHGETLVFSWALLGQKETAKREAKRKPKTLKNPSMAAVNRWLKTASEDELNSLKSLALDVSTSLGNF